MCGIFGFVGRRDAVEALDLDAAVRSLKHRGPDGHGTYRQASGASAGESQACAFVHTRLAILDLTAAADQPMTTQDGRFTIVFNGEVYNFAAIRKELESEGVSIRSTGDTEVVLRSFVRWGEACVHRFRGMFAFAVWDRQTGNLFAARDRMGLKPLYYSEGPSGVAFASELRPLLQLGFSARRLSLPGLIGYLRFGSVQEPDTIVDDVRMLPAGHTLNLCGGSAPTVKRFWDFPPPVSRAVTSDQAVEEVRPILAEAIRLRLVSDVPLGVFLSGGVDSSVVTGLAANVVHRPLQTFTVSFDEKDYSEEHWAAGVAAHYHCDHHQVHLSATTAAAEMEHVLDSLDQPSADGVNTWFISKAARAAGLTVALSGLGGDELFAGYGSFRPFRTLMKLHGIGRAVPKSLYPIVDTALTVVGGGPRLRRILKLALNDADAGESYGTIRCMFMDGQILGLLDRGLRERAKEFMTANPAKAARSHSDPDAVNLFSRLDLENYMKNTLLRDADVMSMRHGLEVRAPLIDHVLVEKVLTIPGRLKLDSSKKKPLLTGAVSTLPASISARPKMGFVFPLDEWLRGPLRAWLGRRFREDCVFEGSCLDPNTVEATLESFDDRSGRMSVSRIWCLFALASVCRRWGHLHGTASRAVEVPFDRATALRSSSDAAGQARTARLSFGRRALADAAEPAIRFLGWAAVLAGRGPETVELVLRGRVLGFRSKWRIGRGVRFVGPASAFDIGPGVTFYGNAYLNASGSLGRISIGAGTHIDQFCVLYGQGGLQIGRDCAIASGVVIYSQTNHDALRDGTPVTRQPVLYREVTIGDGCWLGAGAIILPGVRVGSGATVGAGALVRTDVPPGATVVGLPARTLASK